MQSIELVCDLGSKTVRIAKKDAGIIIAEPAVAVVRYEKKNMILVEAGNKALERVGKLEVSEQIVYPISEGAVTHSKAASLMLGRLIRMAVPYRLIKPTVNVLVCVSCGLNTLEKRDIENVFIDAGASTVTMIESPVAASNETPVKNILLLDIGGSKSEIAIIGTKGIVSGCSLNIAGDTINQAITDFVADKYRTIIQHFTTEKLKRTLASLYQNDAACTLVNGRSISDGEPKSVKIYAYELKEAIAPVIDKLIEAVESVLFLTPDQIAEDLYKGGIYLAGGSAVLPGLDSYLSKKLLMDVRLIANPENAVVNGGSKYFYNKEELARLLNLENIA